MLLCFHDNFYNSARVGKRDTKALRVRCCNVDDGCKWEGTVGILEGHVSTCDFTVVPCPNKCKSSECKAGNVFMLKDLQSHLKTECPNRESRCQFCKRKGTYVSIKQHESSCNMRTVACANTQCSITGIRAVNMKKHLEKCQYSEIPCSYQKFGCKVKVLRKDITAHETDHKIYGKAAQEKMATMETKMGAMETKISTMQFTIGSMQWKINSLEDKVSTMEAKITTLEETLDDDFYDDGGGFVGNEPLVVQGEGVKTQEGEGIKPQEEDVKSQEGGAKSQEEGGKEEGVKSQGMKSPEEERVKSQEEEEHRYMEKKSMTFKFRNKGGACSVFYSPSFYSSTNGYHMRMEVHGNGDEDGKGTHLAVGVRLLEGRYDSELHWPFVGNTTCVLLNQLEDRNHYKRTIKIESDDHVVSGKGMGYPKFFPLCDLAYEPEKNTQYIKDKVMYFRMSVDVPDHKPWLECSAL